MEITQIVNENAVKCKKTILNPSDVPNSIQIYVKSLKKGLHGPDALHELEMLVANLMCVHAKSAAIDSQASKDRPVECDRLVGHP